MKKENIFLRFLYNTIIGRFFLKILIQPKFSKIFYSYLNSKHSKWMVKKYIVKNNIDMSLYEDREYTSFNDFFTRKQKNTNYQISNNNLVSPSDGHISCYTINENSTFFIKKVHYNLEALLNNKKLADEYKDGTCLIIRLAPYNYHRYIFVDSGIKEENIKIPGVLHTVRAIAVEQYPVYIQNAREYSIINSNNFGKIIQMEVGALLIGRICNHKLEKANIIAGEEKGYFEFGGSTIILLLKKNQVKLTDELQQIINTGIEKDVKIGETLGEKILVKK